MTLDASEHKYQKHEDISVKVLSTQVLEAQVYKCLKCPNMGHEYKTDNDKISRGNVCIVHIAQENEESCRQCKYYFTQQSNFDNSKYMDWKILCDWNFDQKHFENFGYFELSDFESSKLPKWSTFSGISR